MSLLLLFLLPPFIMCWLNGMYLAERRNHIDIEEDPLCSCEYMKTDQEGGGRGHLLDCTDDYERMDEFCGTCCARREGVRLLLILENHCIRFPWLGGARRIERRWYPFFVVPLLLWLGSAGPLQNLLQTLFTASLLGWCVSSKNRSDFTPNWLLSDNITTFAAFAYEVGPAEKWLLAVCIPPFLLMLSLHCKVRWVDPGIITAGFKNPTTLDMDNEGANVSKGSRQQQQWLLGSNQESSGDRPRCETCNIIRPPGTKHCQICDHCVQRFDHHCPALNCCIGYGNHRSFLLYLFVSVINAICFLRTVSAMKCTHSTCPFVSSAAAHTFIWSMVTLPLLFLQITQVSLGVTTNECLNRKHENYRYVRLEERPLKAITMMPRNWWRFVCGDSWVEPWVGPNEAAPRIAV